MNPNYATAHQWYSEFLSVMERHTEARAEIQKALALEPLSLIINGISIRLHKWAGQYDEAIEQGIKTLAMDPHYLPTHFFLFQFYYEKKMYDKSFIHFIGYFSTHYGLTNAESETLETLYKNSGWEGVGRFMADKLEIISKNKYVSPSEKSLFYVMMKDYSRALDYLEKGFQMRSPQMVHIGGISTFIDLRGEPRFQALLKKIGLPQ
ncbi:MAG: hypothetical protein E2O77_05170 [Caldithrix sp.]|nr:MAG: hypothetical protein E2O77_05170 [Caldithrix sp.]